MTTLPPRLATAADRPAIEALLHRCDLPLPTGGTVEATFYVVDREVGGLAGCAGLERYGDYGLLRSVAVAPEARGAGLGARLTLAVVEEARRRGLHALYALTTTAATYFPRLGFDAIGRAEVAPAVRESDEFATICPATAVALRLHLGVSGTAAGAVRVRGRTPR